jgi:hypothetical protein
MSLRSNRVEEFRSLVEGVIAGQAKKSGHILTILSFADVHKEADVSGLSFTSVDTYDGRDVCFGMNDEHIWGVASKKLNWHGRVGRLAVVSSEDLPDSFIRRWSFESAMPTIPVDTEKPLKKLNELNDVLTWVRSPHLAGDEFNRFAALYKTEIESVDSELAETRLLAAELHRQLGRLADARKVSYEPEPEDFIILR